MHGVVIAQPPLFALLIHPLPLHNIGVLPLPPLSGRPSPQTLALPIVLPALPYDNIKASAKYVAFRVTQPNVVLLFSSFRFLPPIMSL